MAACSAAALVLVIPLTAIVIPEIYGALRAINKLIPSAHVASAIVGAWLTLLLAGCLRPERSWIDRFGTALGFAWIVISLGDRAVALFVP